MSEIAPTEAGVWQTLRQIIDPELGCNIVDLGLIYEVVLEGAHVRVAMTLTSPGCPMGGILIAAAESALREMPGIADAEVRLVWEPPWSVARMSPAAREQLGVPADACTNRPASVRIRRLYVSPGHNFFGHHGQPASAHPVVEVGRIRCLAGRGIEGDRFLDYKPDYKGQITFFAYEVYRDLCRQLGVKDKEPAVFRRNVITEGLDLNELIGREFEVQGVRFLGTAECSPCYWQDGAFGPGAEQALKGRGGLRAKILSDGVLRLSGDE